MSDMADKSTAIINRAIDILFISHPDRTSLGVILGFALDGIRAIINKLISSIELTVPALWHLIAIGIIILHIPTIISLLRKKPQFDEEIDNILDLIEKANFTKAERKQQYRLLLRKFLEKTVLNEKTKEKLSRI